MAPRVWRLVSVVDPLRPLVLLLPDWSPRRVADACRAGRIPGAVKVGRAWLIRESAFEAWTSGRAPAQPKQPTIDDAIAVLRRHGCAA